MSTFLKSILFIVGGIKVGTSIFHKLMFKVFLRKSYKRDLQVKYIIYYRIKNNNFIL